jgi:hypothetical protein
MGLDTFIFQGICRELIEVISKYKDKLVLKKIITDDNDDFEDESNDTPVNINANEKIFIVHNLCKYLLSRYLSLTNGTKDLNFEIF